MTDPLVSTTWLAEHLLDHDLQVIDATWYMPAEGRLGHDTFVEGHIPGAIFFDIDEVADRATDLPHMLPTPEAFAEAAGRLGLRRDETIVVYDAQGLFSAPRVWWTLRVMGFPKVFVLDGGLPKWRAEDHPFTTGPGVLAETTVEPSFHPELVRGFDDMQSLVAGGGGQIVDARPAARFRGEAPEPREGLRGGHMPGALNLPAGALVGPDGVMKSPEEIRAAFEAAGLDLGRPIVTTCGSGVSASLLALALARLGREDVAVYDGSWTEWGGRADAAVVTGA